MQEFSPESWLNESPPRYNAWKVVEDTARLISLHDRATDEGEWVSDFSKSTERQRSIVRGRCEALTILSEATHFSPADWEQFIIWYAVDHYCSGRRVLGWTEPEDDSYPQPIYP